jgi:hypothetical protein
MEYICTHPTSPWLNRKDADENSLKTFQWKSPQQGECDWCLNYKISHPR